MGTSRHFLNTVPRKSSVGFLMGVFLIFCTVGLASDIAEMGRMPTLRLGLTIFFSGIFPVLYAATGFALRRQFWKATIPMFLVHVFLMNALIRWLPGSAPRTQMDTGEIAHLQSRLNLDGLAIMIAVGLGYGCFLYVSITEGRRYLRVQAEMELAAEIHHVIVPAIDMKLGAFEFYGRSVPSSEVGGDLIDVAGSEENWVAYLADVSGHGVAPGAVMGMVKSAARMLLSSGDDSRHLMSRLNEVLYPLKKPDMFATFCFVAKCGDGLRVGFAGHPAILKFSARTGQITSLEGLNMPLGILPDGDFATSEIQIEAGEMFALYTDGFLEAANKPGEEFGITRFEAELQAHGKGPLDVVYRSVQESVARHGAQFDDQSLLLIRRM
jgi:Stage II sporulation protein E (SpoIIE)